MGLILKQLKSLKKKGVKLIITVDNGIVAFKEAEFINKLKMDLIVTDHHNSLNKLPKAYAVLNPKRQDDLTRFKEISGAVVAFKLVAAIKKIPPTELLDEYADLLLISTIGDVMPLICENRLIVKKGLKILKKTKNVGLKELLNILFKEKTTPFSSLDVSFYVCPILNAAGRLNKAKEAFLLLVETNKQKAKKLAERICLYNTKRKKIEAKMLKEAVSIVLKEKQNFKNNILIVFKEDFLVGLVGIVALRLMNIFKKPAIVLTKQNGLLVGSARSFQGFSIYEALKYVENFLVKWGGHNLAGGLSLKEYCFSDFKEKILNYSKKNRPVLEKIMVDCKTDAKSADLKSVLKLQLLAPFGKENKEPVFLIEDAILKEIVSLKENRHLKLTFLNKGFYFKVLLFNTKIEEFYFKPEQKLNLLVNFSINFFRGAFSVSFKMVDFRPVEFNQKQTVLEFYRFQEFLFSDDFFSKKENELLMPTKKDYAYVYSLFKRIGVFYGNFYSLFLLIFKKINYFKLNVVLKTFVYLNVLEEKEDAIYFKQPTKKLKLNEKLILKKHKFN